MKRSTLAAKPKKARSVKVKRFEKRLLSVKHVFDERERLDLGNKLATAMQTHGEVEAQMKSITGDYKSRLKMIATEGDQYAARIRDGYEMREIECIVHFNMATNERGKPVKKLGMKRVINATTKEFIRDEPMTQADLQAEMFEKKKLENDSKLAKERAKSSQTESPPAQPPADAKDKALNQPEIPNEPGGKSSTAATS